jgi:hypothetical protein
MSHECVNQGEFDDDSPITVVETFVEVRFDLKSNVNISELKFEQVDDPVAKS